MVTEKEKAAELIEIFLPNCRGINEAKNCAKDAIKILNPTSHRQYEINRGNNKMNKIEPRVYWNGVMKEIEEY